MTLIASILGLCSVLFSALLFAGLGRFFLDRARYSIENCEERWLVSIALGVVSFELFVSLGELAPNVRAGVLSALALAIALGLLPISVVSRDTFEILRKIAKLRGLERWLALGVVAVLVLEGFAAMAPLTGSDALHYHFSVPLLVLREGFHPNWFLSHSFFAGLSHQLILAGLATGSERLALGWIYLGGAVASLAAVHLARQWLSGFWPSLAGLTFLLTPVTFWQVTTAGAPDIWMATFVTLGVLSVVRAKEKPQLSAVIFAGVMAGAVAGSKYTGLYLAACLFTTFVWEVRSLRNSIICFASAATTGVWPYLRNVVWSGDPVFPFLMQRVEPTRVNSYALAGYLADTGAAAHRDFAEIIGFPFFASSGIAQIGFASLLGPLVLCFAPLTFLAIRNTPLWRVILVVWLGGAIGIGLSSGMMRFLLPLLPIALVATVRGVAQFQRAPLVRVTALGSVAVFLLFGLGGLVLYDRSSWAVCAGLTSREAYLRQRAPDYARSEFINHYLSGRAFEGRALIFFRHVYYVQVPYAYGHPEASWAMDPQKLQSDEAWRSFFREQQIRWVVRAPDYPEVLKNSLRRLESENIIVPYASGAVEDWVGNRIGGTRELQPITILSVPLE